MTTGTLLSERLSAASADFTAGLGGLGALPLVGEIILNYLVNSEFVRLDTEDGVAELQCSGFCAGHVKHFYLCHLTASLLLSLDSGADLQESALISGNSALNEHQVSVCNHLCEN